MNCSKIIKNRTEIKTFIIKYYRIYTEIFNLLHRKYSENKN